MVAMVEDMLSTFKFLTTPMDLEDHSNFHARLQDANDDHIAQELDTISKKIQLEMKQKEAIPSALPKSLLKSIDIAYVRNLSAYIDLFGYKSGKETIWEDAYAKYVTEVAEGFKEKAKSLQKDDTDSPDLLLINNQLVNKWNWIAEGILSGYQWSTPTRTPLLTQSVIKDFDSLVNGGAAGFSTVSESVNHNLS
jgi:hypothetical protein